MILSKLVNRRKIKKNPMYTHILNLKEELKTYKKLCKISKHSKSTDYTEWKTKIINQLGDKNDKSELENFMHYLLLLKRVNQTTNSVPEYIISFLFGGGFISLFNSRIISIRKIDEQTYEPIYESALIEYWWVLLTIILLIIVFEFVLIVLTRNNNLEVEFYENLIDIINEQINNKQCEDV